MSRDTTGRSYERPEGFHRRPVVSAGNCQVARMCLVLMLLIASRKRWMLEQPGTSIMRESKWMRFIRQLQRVYNVRTWMSCFGAETQKATQLESGSLWVNRLHRKRNIKNTQHLSATAGVRHESPDRTGRIRVTGHAGLKSSQEYSRACTYKVNARVSSQAQLTCLL